MPGSFKQFERLGGRKNVCGKSNFSSAAMRLAGAPSAEIPRLFYSPTEATACSRASSCSRAFKTVRSSVTPRSERCCPCGSRSSVGKEAARDRTAVPRRQARRTKKEAIMRASRNLGEVLRRTSMVEVGLKTAFICNSYQEGGSGTVSGVTLDRGGSHCEGKPRRRCYSYYERRLCEFIHHQKHSALDGFFFVFRCRAPMGDRHCKSK